MNNDRKGLCSFHFSSNPLEDYQTYHTIGTMKLTTENTTLLEHFQNDNRKIIERDKIDIPNTVIVKPAHVVTSNKQSPVLGGHLFLFQSYYISYKWNLF